jgi:hypothetical protein
MKKLLLAGVATLAFANFAHADNVIKEQWILSRRWCLNTELEKHNDFYAYNECSNPNGEDIVEDEIRITPRRLEGYEFSCDFVSVRQRHFHDGNGDWPAADIVATCYGEGCHSRERITLEFMKERLFVRQKLIGKSWCEK